MNVKYNFNKIHSECGWHDKAIITSHICGCFYCLKMFAPSKIEDWIDVPKNCLRTPGRTALCPYCGIDAVLPESEHYKLTIDLLKAMHKQYF